jgi:hypothetical protein
MSNYPEIDLLDADTMSDAEIDGLHRRLLRRGITGYPLSVFALWTQHDPSVLKRYMLQVDAQMPTPEAAKLNNLATLHHYAVLRFAPGIAWELDVAARAGFTRREVLDVLALAYLNSGPSTQGPVHDAASARLREWRDPCRGEVSRHLSTRAAEGLPPPVGELPASAAQAGDAVRDAAPRRDAR